MSFLIPLFCNLLTLAQIPLLVIILATITNQFPHAWDAAQTTYAAFQDRYQLPTVRVGM